MVITSLPNGDIVKACYAEVLPAAKEGTLFIDTSTISVDDARTINSKPPTMASRNSTHRCQAE